MHPFLRIFPLLAFTLGSQACAEVAPSSDSGFTDTTVDVGAAFTDLERVDVYDLDGDLVATIDATTDFSDVLPSGDYYMDFVDQNGQHSFLEDGRLAFAPMGYGILPVDGPFFVDDIPMWQVAVSPALEANANLSARVQLGDQALAPWKHQFADWQMALPPEDRDPPTAAHEKAYSTTTGSTTARLRVTWEAAFAMTGNFSGACNSATSCWTARGDGYAYWDADSNGTGYIDYDTSAWSTMLGRYTSGNGSCTQSGYDSATYGTCYLSVGTGTAKNYTCQSSTGSCTGGTASSATKPRGGQCKFFQNLVLYRSGQFTGTLPTDSTISGYSSPEAPTTSTSNIAVGDVLRRLGSLHSEIVVAYDSAAQTAIVVDSNYSGGANREYIGYRTNGFSTASYSGYTLLSNYRNLKCVYGVTDTNDRDRDGSRTDTFVCTR